MTLNTRLRVTDPADAAEVFDFCATLIGLTSAHLPPWTDEVSPGRHEISNTAGHGLPALLTVSYGDPLPAKYADLGDTASTPDAFLEVSFDTVYAYSDAEGGCRELHRRYTSALGAWLTSRGIGWTAQDEDSQEWHLATPCPL